MIKALLLFFSVGLFLCTISTFSDGSSITLNNSVPVWKKCDKNFWLGSDYKCYKLDSNKVLQISDDFINWRNATDSTWKDRLGIKMCMSQSKLLRSLNDQEWIEVPENKWQSIDGNWYRFDKSGKLMKAEHSELMAGK